MRPDRLTKLHGAVDRQAGESIRVLPYVAGGYLAGGPDPSRPAVDLLAEVTEVAKVSRHKGSGASTGRNAELRLGSHTIKYMTAALPYPLADGDRVVLLDRGAAVLKAAGADPIGTGRTIARLEPLPPLPPTPPAPST